MYSNLVHMLDNTNSFFIVEGSANCFGTIHVMFVVLIFLVFLLYLNAFLVIVKRDMALSSDEV